MAAKKSRSLKGDGSIMEILKPDGTSYNPKRWRVRVDRGIDPVTNKRRKPLSRNVTGTKKEARKKRNELRREIEEGIKPEADKLTFREMCEIYKRNRKQAGKISAKTLRDEVCHLDFMCEILGDILLKQVTPQVVEELYPEIRKRRIAQGYGCGNTTLHAYHTLLKALMKKAMHYDFILRNPCDRVESPKLDPVARRSLTPEEAERLLHQVDVSEENAYSALKEKEARQKAWHVEYDRSFLLGMRDVCSVLAIRIALASGMRLSEVLRLTWGDLRSNVLTVRRQTTKTDAGHRTVAIDKDTLKHLKRWKKYQAQLLTYIDQSQTEETPLLCCANGRPLDKRNFEPWWKRWREDHGFPDLKFHELRHTQATQLLANGVDVKTVQTRLGHSDPSITLKWYAHAVSENDQAAAELIGDLFTGKSQARDGKRKSA